jgi:methylase of polypeptide subunit release factors
MTPTDPPAFSAVDNAPRSDDPAAVDHLTADLDAADYRFDAVTTLLGEAAMNALLREQLLPAQRVLRRSGDRGALAVLIRLFLLGESVGAQDVDAALPRTGAQGARGLGVLESDPGNPDLIRAAIDLRPHASDVDQELWVASDVGALHRPGVLRHDHVLGIGRASLTLASSTIRRSAERALDLGVGCGIQTFHLLSHCDHVTATDLSERALGFTRFNLLLNARALDLDPHDLSQRVSLLQGSLLEPVRGREFDLVVSNPPFVITPRRSGDEDERFTYRDGGMAGDRLVAQLVSELPTVLRPGGTAQMLANWEVPQALVPDDATSVDPVTGTTVPGWAAGVAGWVPDGTECWVIQRDLEDPCGYAETWLTDAAESRDREAYRARYADYLDDFEARGVGGVGLGMIWLRVPHGAAGVGRRYEYLSQSLEQPLGPALAAAIFRADALSKVDVGLVNAVVAADTTMETHSVPGEEHPRAILLRQGSGLRRVRGLDTALAGLVSACDGELNLRSLATAVSALMGSGALDRDEDEQGETAPAATDSEPTGEPVDALLERAAGLILDGFLDFPPASV